MKSSIEKVLLLSNSSNVGGGNRSLLLLEQEFSVRQVEAMVIVPQEGQMSDACRRQATLFEAHSLIQPSWRRPDLLWSNHRSWKRILTSFSAQVVHANDITTARSVILSAKRLGIPVVCHIRFPPTKEVIKWAFRRFPKPEAFIFNSHAMQDECGADFRHSCPQSKQFVIHNAVDLEQFVPREKPPHPQRVGILANLIPVKGHPDFLQMAKKLTERGQDAEYWLIGEDIHQSGYRAELEELTTTLGLQQRVHFLGHRNDIPEVLSGLDVLVCASHVEPFGRCLIEAMACEKAVVATNVGGIPEVVEDGQTGILVSPNSPAELADAVESLLSNPSKCEMMGKTGRQRAQQLFSRESHVESVLQIYHSVLGADHRLNNPTCESVHA